jgi:hypothetical protein
MAPRSPSVLSAEDIQSVAPALARFGSEVLIGISGREQNSRVATAAS